MKKHILYSFRRCPYAIRTRWALIHFDIDFEIREIDLKKKPKDVLNKSRYKTVPLLITKNNEVIDQSLNIILWAHSINKNFNSEKYYSQELGNQIRDIIKENDEIFKFHLDRFKYSSRYKNEPEICHLNEIRKILYSWNKLLTKSEDNYYWLLEGKETIADWCLFPFVRQYKIACMQKKISYYFEEPLNSWLSYFEGHSIFKKIMLKCPLWIEN